MTFISEIPQSKIMFCFKNFMKLKLAKVSGYKVMYSVLISIYCLARKVLIKYPTNNVIIAFKSKSLFVWD